MALTVGTNSWVTETEADEFFEDRLGASDWWTAGESDNVPALITAYIWLVSHPKYSFPATVVTLMKNIQCEMALFLMQHQPDIDLRMGLQAQNVTHAGVVKEIYEYGNLAIPIPPVVASLAYPYLDEKNFYIEDLERDEEELTSYDAPTNLDRS